MNKLGITLLLFLSTTHVKAASTPTTVTDVTIYNQGALVTRSAAVDVPAGEYQLELQGFPSGIDPQGLRLEVNNKDVRLGQVNLKENKFIEATDPQVVALKEKIDLKQDEILEVQGSTKAAKLQLTFLESLATGYSKEAWIGSADTASWQRALALMQSGSQAANKIIRKDILSLKKLNAELSLLKRQLADKRGRRASNNSVIAYLSSALATRVTIKVHYYQDAAGWNPSYEARLDSNSGKLVLTQKAVLWQSTQEPWLNTKVSLSTSQPSQEMQAPELDSEFYDLREKQIYQRARAAKGYASADSQILEEVLVTGTKAGTWSGSYSQNFPIAGRIDVSNNDDQSQAYALEKFEFDSQLHTLIVPLIDPQAFLLARFNYQGNQPIYGDEMLVYVDGVLMGTATMPDILPGAEVSLPMGVDRQIEVTVNNLGGKGGDGGIINKQVTEVKDFEFEITNRRPSIANIEVQAVYPVSKNRSLKIRIGDKASPPTQSDVDGKPGVNLWKKQLAAGERWSINYQYSITRPADRELQTVYD